MSDTYVCCNIPSVSGEPATPSDVVPLPGISTKTWDKFQQLKKRREEQSRRSVARRVDEIKADVAAKILEQFSNDDEIEALQQNNVDISRFGKNADRRKKCQIEISAIGEQSTSLNNTVATDSSECSDKQSEWLDIRQHLNVNSHLSEETGGSGAPKSRLERTINLAIAADEFQLAEELSDRLANRDFGAKIAAAFDAKKFIEKRKIEDDAKKAAKKKKLAWGFEHKQRWETKGNM